MEKLLEEVKKMLHLVTQAVYFYKKQNYIKGNSCTTSITIHGEKFFSYAKELGFDESIELMLPVWKELLEASESGNEIYLSDLYESRLIPVLFDIQAFIINYLDGKPLIYWKDNMDIIKNKDTILYNILSSAKESEERQYIFSWACTGDPVLSVETKKYGQVLLSSSVNPWQEAIIYGDGLTGDYANCVIIGLGMGYHVKYIINSSYFKKIVILESDLEQLRICMMYTDMRTVLSDSRVKIVLCSKAEDYSKWLKKNNPESSTIYKIWYPSVKTIENDAIRELLENYWINTSSSDNFENAMFYNFENNQKLADEPLDNIKDKFEGKDIVIIGAGPSLDNNLDYLRKFLNRDNVVIVCVGKAAKKLISENIMPSYIVVIDAKKGTRWQIKGIENCGVPLIYLSTAAYNLVSEYNGKRYIAYQEGIEPSKKYAKENNLLVYESGGSVATFAIDMAIRMKCKQVICVGLDMGYIGSNTHAEGIGRKLQNKKSLRKAESVSGGEIYTSKTLDIYRRWIERRIENVTGIEFINSSKGARIHGMEEKSLKEITESYCKQKIYCYVEEHGKELDKFIKNNNNDSLVNIYYSVISECEGNISYCLCDIADKYMKSDKKLWFVTDIKNLYNIVKKLYSFLFEKIIYIEQENKKDFEYNLKSESLINYFINIQENDTNASLISRIYHLKESTILEDFFKFLLELDNVRIEENEKFTRLLCCICQVLLYNLEKNIANKEYYKLTLYSIIMKISKNVFYTNLYLSKIIEYNKINNENMYFIYQSIKRLAFTNQISMDKHSWDIIDTLYNKCYKEYSNSFKEYLVKMPSKERKKNLIMVMTVQFLNNTHAPTNSIIERIKILKALGKDVVLINTTEFCLLNGYVPLYGFNFANVMEEYNDLNEIEMGDYLIPFLQIPDDLPLPYRMKILIHVINKIKPYYILSIGNGSMLADLCGNIVPCASMALVFSTLPKTMNKMKILGRKLNNKDKEFYADKDIDIIESRFTFELKLQKEHYSRKDKNLPDNKFIIAIIGTRLKFDITKEFMKILQKVCKSGCYIVFAGIMDNYDKLMKEYPIVAANSSFIGYCDDILALMEICDLYVNPDRLGGGFSIIEAFSKGVPGVYLKSGDVYTAGGEDFAVNDFDGMVKQILRYKDDKDYYNKMSEIAKERAKLMTSSVEAIADIDRQICQRIEEKYW